MNIDFEKVLERTDIQHLRSFLLYGKECESLSSETYERRAEEPQRAVTKLLEKKISGMEDSDALNDSVMNAVAAYTDVFMELGLQAGMRLAVQALGGENS